MSRQIETPWGEVTLVSTCLPASEPDFDLAPAWLRELVEPHFGADHEIWVERTAIDLERIECRCGSLLWEREA